MAAAAAKAADLSPKFDIAKDRLKRGEVNGEVKGRDGKADSRCCYCCCCYVNTEKESSNKKNTLLLLLLLLQRLMFIFVGKCCCCCCLSQKINLQVLSAVRRGKRGKERQEWQQKRKSCSRERQRGEEITIIRGFSLFKLIRSRKRR